MILIVIYNDKMINLFYRDLEMILNNKSEENDIYYFF